MLTTLELAKQLIAIESITPNDNGCQTLIRDFLAPLGFTIHDLSHNNVTNTLALLGTPSPDAPFLLFSGHTDVVPTGPKDQWQCDPFTPTEKDGKLFGRGSADMKTAIAAMLVACQEWIGENNTINGCIGFAITSDEEGSAIDGSQVIAEYLKEKNYLPQHVLIGEATCVEHFGDMIKIGRRGSLCGTLRIIGKQGHIAYPHKAKNPIHDALKALDGLCRMEWDQGNANFQPSSFQISNIHAGTGATNIIPGELHVDFNFRFCPESHPDNLIKHVETHMHEHGLTVDYTWQLIGMPYYSPEGKLREACRKAIFDETGIETTASTFGGGSDGRFFAPLGAEVIEFGFINSSIHQINECIALENIEPLKNIYLGVLRHLTR